MDDYHIVLGTLGFFIGTIAYIPYLRDIYRGTTKPHPFTWFVFAIVNGIAFFAQLSEGGGPGSWILGLTVVACTLFTLIGLKVGRSNITLFDWVCFVAALFGVLLWILTNDALIAVVVATVTDFLAFLPTVRKGYAQPYSETASLFFLGGVKYALGISALQTFTLTTVLFAGSITILNFLFVIMLLIRRRQLKGTV